MYVFPDQITCAFFTPTLPNKMHPKAREYEHHEVSGDPAKGRPELQPPDQTENQGQGRWDVYSYSTR